MEEGRRPHMLHIFSFQGRRGGDVEQSGLDKSASGRHGHRGLTLTTVGGEGDSSGVAFSLPFASLSKLNLQRVLFFFFLTWIKKSNHLFVLNSSVLMHASGIHHSFSKSHECLWSRQKNAKQEERGN